MGSAIPHSRTTHWRCAADDCFVEGGKLYIATEYAPGGTLHEYVSRQRGGGLQEAVVWRLLVQLAAALQHMHGQKVLHRDIKSLNVFLGDKGVVKMGDLGVAKVLSTQTNFAQTVVGVRPRLFQAAVCCPALGGTAALRVRQSRSRAEQKQRLRADAVLPVAGALLGAAVQRPLGHLGARRCALRVLHWPAPFRRGEPGARRRRSRMSAWLDAHGSSGLVCRSLHGQ
jgi:serine/threonine protein kinase